jgi:hypothetical protein
MDKYLEMAIKHGMLVTEDDAPPANSDKNIDTDLPAYAADDEARKRRQTLIRRLKKMLKDRDQRWRPMRSSGRFKRATGRRTKRRNS